MLSAVVVAFAVWVALLQYVEGDVFTRILLVRCTLLLYSILADEGMLLMFAVPAGTSADGAGVCTLLPCMSGAWGAHVQNRAC